MSTNVCNTRNVGTDDADNTVDLGDIPWWVLGDGGEGSNHGSEVKQRTSVRDVLKSWKLLLTDLTGQINERDDGRPVASIDRDRSCYEPSTIVSTMVQTSESSGLRGCATSEVGLDKVDRLRLESLNSCP